MGGLISALYLLDHQAEFTGAVLSGPAVKTAGKVSPAVAFAGKVVSVVLPKFGVMALEADGVSRDPAVVQAYRNDPLVYTGKMTARWGAESLKAMRRIIAEAGRITLPILILQGSADKVIDPDGAKILYAAISSSDKTIKIYDGFYHEVFNEPEHDQVLRDVETWLEAHLGY
jgi:alpha-beta hydrolase superfamily lysophospholipase